MMLCVFMSYRGHAQIMELDEAIRYLTGVSEIESVDADVVENYHQLSLHPIDINKAGRSEMESSGLFTPYQLVSLSDYIERHGQVLTMVELASVDGFSKRNVEALSPFITILYHPDISKVKERIRTDVFIRGGYKSDMSRHVDKSTYGLKARIDFSDRFIISFAATEPYDSMHIYPTLYTGNLVCRHSRGKIIIGDFNARFGQGLNLWNTATFSSFSAPSNFMRRPSGLAASNSFTGSTSLTGIASDLDFGRWKLAMILYAPGLKQAIAKADKVALAPVVNLNRYGDYGQCGITHSMSFSSIFTDNYRIPLMKTSLDASYCIRGVNVFGEVAFDWVQKNTDFLSGIEAPAGESGSMAALLRYRPLADERGIALSGEHDIRNHEIVWSLDALYHPKSKRTDNRRTCQLKSQLNWLWTISDAMQIKVRLSERLRTWGTMSKCELRSDFNYHSGNWRTSLRLDALYGTQFACLGYLEAGYVARRLSAYMRYGMFKVDNWDDRIYVYERDAPGNFNVPAFYKRGLWTSLYVSVRVSKLCKLYLRGIYKKPGNAELKLYCSLIL